MVMPNGAQTLGHRPNAGLGREPHVMVTVTSKTSPSLTVVNRRNTLQELELQASW